MPKDDYSSAASGGLRLKGVNPSSKISKQKKKRPKAPAEAEKSSAKSEPEASEKPKERSPKDDDDDDDDDGVLERVEVGKSGDESGEGAMARGKTPAELQHEERRRRRLEERLKREGTKTHKERVEEFNHYLSNLSEHHDMPRIGPG
ncbi:MAG: hypothetical protein Q9212_002711 [Teloschistes hypoglaucus]